MFIYDKKLQYPVKIDRPNPKLASIIISQYGGPDGELGASLRYLSQRYSMPFDEPKGTTYKYIKTGRSFKTLRLFI
jgi:spore coat protein JC